MGVVNAMSAYFKIEPYKNWRRDNRDEWLVSGKDIIQHRDSYDMAFKFLFETMNLEVAQLFIPKPSPKEDRSPIVYEIHRALYYLNSDVIRNLVENYVCTGFVFDDHETALKAQYELDKLRMWNLLKR
jgi:hypothetical protein